MKSIIAILATLLILGGCTYHYSLHVSIGPPASPTLPDGDSEGVEQKPPAVKPVNPDFVKPQAQSEPMSIEPGQFTVSQSKGGSMINVVLNINSAKPVEVTTDTSLSGVPGM